MKASQITLVKNGNEIVARFAGIRAGEIFRLFGTYDLPTAYTMDANIDEVLADMTRRWPDCNVIAQNTLRVR